MPVERRLSRAESKLRTRLMLIDAAAQVFAQHGFAGATVDQIAEAAGFTTGALYAHFASKEDLFVELVAQRSSDRVAEASAILAAQAADLDGLRTAMSHLLGDAVHDDEDIVPLQAEMWLYAVRRPEVLQHLARQFEVNRNVLAAALETRAENRGQDADVDFADVATVLMALFEGLLKLRRTDPGLVREDLFGLAAHWVFAGINVSESGASPTNNRHADEGPSR